LAGSAANSEANSMTTHIFTPIAIDTAGSRNQQAIDVIEDIGRRISMATEVGLVLIPAHFSRDTTGYAVSFMSIFDIE